MELIFRGKFIRFNYLGKTSVLISMRGATLAVNYQEAFSDKVAEYG